ncbi:MULTISPECIES: DUF1501 domain-containing protein [unclassified Polaribacter]|uniref:DUF1501 domain-containing protein n=1 Tax=unclassified Polaribacter TaxID=196858 RepID=UPI0011BE7486|nr:MULTISPECIES: DUF1501 domain-containing protein [unclassified Polaribacter]TXD51354.1 DUF1501 domain-containing protein [Polaribacter sp. IC063]TXD61988.1 DUF1501 domain-containing protein [Polaribacter sp. IC066]
MERRDFLKQSTLASSLFFVPNFVKAFENISKNTSQHKKLVIIQLSGGNDGLNTIIPYTNDIYYRNRPKLSISKNDVIKATDMLGFHQNLAPLKNLYDQGYLSIINNVGYPNPNRSHFRSTDIWQTAGNSDEYINSGWVGRFIEKYGKNPYAGIELDDSLSLLMKGENMNGIATKNPKILFGNTNTPFFKKVLKQQTAEHLSEHNLGYLYKTMIEAKSSAKYIYETSKTYKSNFEYPNNPFGKQLKTAAEFINSGLNTKVYYASMGGFDTHANQVNRHSKLLTTYSESIEIFINDLKKSDTFKDTLILTFSEFGRRVQQNAAGGTDHGAANNVFIMGVNLKKKGFYNEAANLLSLDANGDVKYTVDFRSIYSTILDKWLQADDASILNKSFKKLDFI